MSYGWLAPRPDIKRDTSWFGVDLDPTLRTRWEEFTLARDALEAHGNLVWLSSRVYQGPARLLDMGCGFEPRVHVMPEIATVVGWEVEAIDILDAPGPTHLWAHNPPHPRIRRRLMDMRHTDYPDEHFDAVLSISVLEHVSPADREATYAEARRVLKPGGLLVITMDGNWPTHVSGFRFGDPVIPQVPLTNDLHQPVCFLVGSKT